jgi:hypothetical protein
MKEVQEMIARYPECGDHGLCCVFVAIGIYRSL